jgi:hypothetical protein
LERIGSLSTSEARSAAAPDHHSLWQASMRNEGLVRMMLVVMLEHRSNWWRTVSASGLPSLLHVALDA